MARELTEDERNLAADMLDRARAAMAEIEGWSQARLDRLSQAIAWYAGNEKTFTRLAQMGVDESGIGDRDGRPGKRFKIHMVLRDVLRTPSTGIVEVDEMRGLVKYAKPAGRDRIPDPDDEPGDDPPGNGGVFGQRPERRHLQPASTHGADDLRDGRGHARRLPRRGRARRPVPVNPKTVDPADPASDEHL